MTTFIISAVIFIQGYGNKSINQKYAFIPYLFIKINAVVIILHFIKMQLH